MSRDQALSRLCDLLLPLDRDAALAIMHAAIDLETAAREETSATWQRALMRVDEKAEAAE